MDALTSEVVAVVLWGASVPIAFWLLPLGLGLIGSLFDDHYSVRGTGTGAFLGLLGAVGWSFFAVIQLILHAIALVQVFP